MNPQALLGLLISAQVALWRSTARSRRPSDRSRRNLHRKAVGRPPWGHPTCHRAQGVYNITEGSPESGWWQRIRRNAEGPHGMRASTVHQPFLAPPASPPSVASLWSGVYAPALPGGRDEQATREQPGEEASEEEVRVRVRRSKGPGLGHRFPLPFLTGHYNRGHQLGDWHAPPVTIRPPCHPLTPTT